MADGSTMQEFPKLNRAYNTVFRPGRLSLGLVVPLEAYPNSAAPTMDRHIERVRLAEELGFASLWLRDVPFNVPNFGDAGQMFDPFVYLGLLAGVTDRIGLGVASVILPLRHPAHVAKAVASADQLSGGRVLLGVASGDRPDEYPAMGMSFPDRGARFRDSLGYIEAMAADYPTHTAQQGVLNGGIDMLPKPVAGRVPMLITGGSQQDPDWVAAHGDGWITYPRDVAAQEHVVSQYRARSAEAGAPMKPVTQSLYVDVLDDDTAAPRPIHLGFQSGVGFLATYLGRLEALGVNHVALNLRFNTTNVEDTMKRLADSLMERFGI